MGKEQPCWAPSVGDMAPNLGEAARGAHGGERAEGQSKAPECPEKAWPCPLGLGELSKREEEGGKDGCGTAC